MQKIFLHFLVFTNAWIGIAAGAQAYISAQLVHSGPPLFYFFLVLSGTMFLYNFQRLIKNAEIGNDEKSIRHQWIEAHKSLLIFISIAAFCSTWILVFYFLNQKQIAWLFLAGSIGIFYTGIPKTPFKGLRVLPYTKAFLVALSWSIICVTIPVFNTNTTMNEYPLFIRFFILIFSLAIIFDIRDLLFDDPKMKTIPQLLGKRNSYLLSLSLLGVNIFLAVLYENFALLISESITFLFAVIIFLRLQKEEKEILFGFFTDGIILLNAILIAVFSII